VATFSSLDLPVSNIAMLALLAALIVYQQIRLYIIHQRLRRREELFRIVTENAADMIALVDVKGRRLYNSPSYKRILGYSPAELSETSAFEQIHPEDRHKILEASREAKSSGVGKELRYRIRHKNGTWRIFESNASTIKNKAGVVEKLVIVNRDVTDKQQIEEQLVQNSFHDPLTGLPNRRLFLDRLQRCYFRAQRNPEYRYAILYVDIDGFKELSDRIGRSGTDLVILELGRRLRAGLRHDDTVARPRMNASVKDLILSRLGEDEFTILLEGVEEPSNAMRVAQRIRAAAMEPLMVQDRTTRLSASIGIAISKMPQDLPEDLLRDADMAMRRAKALGGGRCEISDEKMHLRAIARLKLEGDLKDALALNQLVVHYQPVVRLADGQFQAFEALLRWKQPTRGLVSPYSFLDVAEPTGLMLEIDKIVLPQACRQMCAWHSQFPNLRGLSITVNLSPKHFARPDLVSRLENALADTGLQPTILQVEVTENTLMADLKITADVLAKLKQLGVRILVDGFGAGHLPVSYLARCGVNAVKIDRSLISGMLTDRISRDIVDAIITLAHKLNLEVIAGGVEKAGQVTALQAQGCDSGQGYFFSPPLDGESCERLLREQSSGGRAKGTAAQ